MAWDKTKPAIGTIISVSNPELLANQAALETAIGISGGVLKPTVPKSLFDANTILYATTDDTPVALTVAASRIVGRAATGAIAALSAAQVNTILGTVIKTDFNANTILAADTNNTPVALTIAEQRLVGRITSGNIVGLTAAQVRTLINVENGSTADQTEAQILALLGLAAVEVDQVGNIGSTTISGDQWGYLGAADQGIWVTTLKARAYLAGAQNNIPDTTATKILLDTESWDPGNAFASYKYTVTKAGYYQVNGCVGFVPASVIVDKAYSCMIRVNNSDVLGATQHSTIASSLKVLCGGQLLLAVDDYVELFVYLAVGAATVDIQPGTVDTFMDIHFLSNA